MCSFLLAHVKCQCILSRPQHTKHTRTHVHLHPLHATPQQLAAAAEKKKAKKQAALAAAAAAEEKARQDRIKLLDTSWQPRVPLGHISRTWGKPRPGKAGAVVDKLGEKKNTGTCVTPVCSNRIVVACACECGWCSTFPPI